jgi:phytoene desaturase
MRTFTPENFRTELSAHMGSAFSLEPVLWQSAYFRAHNRDDVLKNLYFVGAGTHPGAGIPGVVGSAKATAKLLLEDLGVDAAAAAAAWPSNGGPMLEAAQ